MYHARICVFGPRDGGQLFRLCKNIHRIARSASVINILCRDMSWSCRDAIAKIQSIRRAGWHAIGVLKGSYFEGPAKRLPQYRIWRAEESVASFESAFRVMWNGSNPGKPMNTGILMS